MVQLTQLLQPFIRRPLSSGQLDQLHLYLELLMKWNAKISLTAIRAREDIVARHFGESLFAAEHLKLEVASTLIDFGSGAGFPGIPIKIFAPELTVTLIESQHKKAAFLREVIRTVKLQNVSVYAGRAQDFPGRSQIVTMRAVEKFESALPVAVSLFEPGGRLALLIGSSQVETARRSLANVNWEQPTRIPESRERVLLVGRAAS